jgi:Carbohydrate phosphorylase/Cytidylate kinase-like family
VRWIPETEVKGVAYDTPILGYRVETCNILRLWKAEAVESFDFAAFNLGDYDRAVEEKVASETITKVLYPNDEAHRGKELRLKQQFFFTSCSLQDMLRIHAQLGGTPATFHEKWAVQLNDTHPAVAVAFPFAGNLNEAATAGGVVLIGRGAHVICANLAHVFHVLVAPLESRVEHIADYFKLIEKEAAEYVEKTDRVRKQYVRRYGNVAIYSHHMRHLGILRKVLLRMKSWMNYIFSDGH